jgi:hypothetical protein
VCNIAQYLRFHIPILALEVFAEGGVDASVVHQP